MILTGPPTRARTVLATVFALAAFAANSVLCRLVLRPGAIDAASFSTIRLMSGAAMLLLLSRWAPAPTGPPAGSWMSAAVLALYAVPFSFAYIGLSTGTGALILFGSVQVTMMAGALRSGERPLASQWLGLGLALVGLVYLVLPGIAAPPPLSAGLMALAGLAWGIYSLRGRGAVNPLAQTTSAFVRSVPIALALSAIFFRQFHARSRWHRPSRRIWHSRVGYGLCRLVRGSSWSHGNSRGRSSTVCSDYRRSGGGSSSCQKHFPPAW